MKRHLSLQNPALQPILSPEGVLKHASSLANKVNNVQAFTAKQADLNKNIVEHAESVE